MPRRGEKFLYASHCDIWRIFLKHGRFLFGEALANIFKQNIFAHPLDSFFHKRPISIVRKVFFVKKANNAQKNAFLGQNLAIRQLAGGLFRVLDATDGIPIILEEARFAPIIVVIDQYYADCIFAVATDIGRIDNAPFFAHIYSEQMCN